MTSFLFLIFMNLLQPTTVIAKCTDIINCSCTIGKVCYPGTILSNSIRLYYCCGAKSPEEPVQCGTLASFSQHYGCRCENLRCNVTTTSNALQQQWCKINDNDVTMPRGCLLTTAKISTELVAEAYPGFFNETVVSKGLLSFIDSASTCNDMCPSTIARTPPTTTESLVQQSSTTTATTFQPTPQPTTTPLLSPISTPMPMQPTTQQQTSFPTPYPTTTATTTTTKPANCSLVASCEKCLSENSDCEWCQSSTTVGYCRSPMVAVCNNDYPDAVRVCSLTKQVKPPITESAKNTATTIASSATTLFETLSTSTDASLETTAETDIISIAASSSTNIFYAYFWQIIIGIIVTVILTIGICLCIAFRKSINISYHRMVRQQYLCAQCYDIEPRVIFISKSALDEHQSQKHSSSKNQSNLQQIGNNDDKSRCASIPRTSSSDSHVYHAPPYANIQQQNATDGYKELPLFQQDRYQSSFNEI